MSGFSRLYSSIFPVSSHFPQYAKVIYFGHSSSLHFLSSLQGFISTTHETSSPQQYSGLLFSHLAIFHLIFSLIFLIIFAPFLHLHITYISSTVWANPCSYFA